jgi:hypothetical protein
MEDKKGIKRAHSPSTEGSPLPNDTITPPSAPSGSSPPPGSPLKVSLCRPFSPVFEQGNASEKTLMIDPSSFIIDTSCDVELTRKLFGDLNRDILDDSDDNAEAQEEKTASIESTTALASADLALSAPTSADDAPTGAKISNSDDQGPNQEVDGGDDGGRSTSEP